MAGEVHRYVCPHCKETIELAPEPPPGIVQVPVIPGPLRNHYSYTKIGALAELGEEIIAAQLLASRVQCELFVEKQVQRCLDRNLGLLDAVADRVLKAFKAKGKG